MQRLIPAAVHRLLYRFAYRARRTYRRTFRQPICGVSAVLTDMQGRVLLVRHSYGPAGWTLPGGGHGRREDPASAVQRELAEELSLEIAGLELVEVFEEVLSGAPHTSRLFSGVAVGEPRPDGREVIAAQFFAWHDLPEHIPERVKARLDIWFETAGQSSES
jgi:ADP-ribose pyrophosphatase YjhB (NUDIX family)